MRYLILTFFAMIAVAISASGTPLNYEKRILGAWLCHIPGKTDRIVIFHRDGSWGVPFSVLAGPENWNREDTRGRRWRIEGNNLIMSAPPDGGQPSAERIVVFSDTGFETEVNGIRISYRRTKLWPRKSPNQSVELTATRCTLPSKDD
jgi:hypothetical protein